MKVKTMQLNTIFNLSTTNKAVKMAMATVFSLGLAACGGDINLSSEVDNSVGDTIYESGGGNEEVVIDLPGLANSALSATVSAAVGFDVQVQVLSGEVSEDTSLIASADGVTVMYAISGGLEVMADATLTIPEGTVLFGQEGADYLVIHRDAQIMAQGSADQPIIFTSIEDVVGDETSAGQWGGIVILGNAPSNKCPSDGSDCAIQVEGVSEGAVFGGTDSEDSSGTLEYVVVKFAGYEVSVDNELNGITFGGVGSGTTLDYIQVHANADDGVEFFGGSASIKHLVLTGNQDDSVDWDNGYQGKLQHVYIEHAVNAGEANRAIEADNDGTDHYLTPQSNPTISNMTIVGNNFTTADKDSEGIYLREGTNASIYNTVVTGTEDMGECLEFDAGGTIDNATSGTLVMQNTVMACTNGENFKNDSDDTTGFDLETWFLAGTNNSVSTSILLDDSGIPDNNSVLVGMGQDVASVDSWFDTTDYIGAFDSADASDNDWRDGWAFGYGGGIVTAAVEAEGCPEGTDAISSVDGVTTTCQLSGVITSDLTLTSGNIYALDGGVFVGNDKADSATLTIEAGTTIYGRDGADYLVVSRDSKIEAEGSSSSPITFTSVEDLTGEATSAGQWGGIVLLGNAQTNKCTVGDDTCSVQVEGVTEGGVYGGIDDTDSSGTLRYVVVKHAGYEISTDNELNGITFGAVGSGTTVEYIQVHENADDGVEFFGGAVNLKYVVLTSNQDDSVDWDQGYRGNMQYVLVKHASDDSAANRAIEADNDGTTPDTDPQSNPTIANMTIIGNAFSSADAESEGIYLREGTKAQLHNFVVTNAAGECLEIEGGTSSVTVDQALAGDTVITNSVFACSENFKDSTVTYGTDDVSDDLAFDASEWVLTTNDDNSEAAAMSDVVSGVYTIDTTTPKVFTDTSFFDNTDHIGAVSADDDWTADWTVGLED